MADFAKFGNDLYTGKRSIPVVPRRKIWYIISIVLAIISLLGLGVRGLSPSIEFRGGSEFMVLGTTAPEESIARETVAAQGGTEPPRVSVVGEDSVRIQTERLSNEETLNIRHALADAYDVGIDDVTSSYVGPTWGADVTTKAIQALVIFLGLVALIMTLYFRTWTMAVAGLIALLQDLVLTVGVYTLVGFEVSPATVIGFLTILGYSLYDTVVVFDKVRENAAGFQQQSTRTYAELANLAVNQTVVRSVNTAVVALLPIGSILFIGSFVLGAGTLRDISLALFVGTILGTFSSVFIATPIEVDLHNRKAATAAHTKRVEELRESGTDMESVVLVEGEEGDLSTASAVVPGGHRGVAAQPRRKRGKSKNRRR
ncbi:MAG TPA: protein translocase subunit SecF [Actinomycetales bacterium]|nr:protein translocase subunit SecF [Actinomycetales bacterium]